MAALPSPSSSSPSSLSSFLTQQARLVALERAEEEEQEKLSNAAIHHSKAAPSPQEKAAVRSGLCLSRLVLTDCASGLYGRCLVTFVPERGSFLPASTISVRDIVHIQQRAGESSDGDSQQWWSQPQHCDLLPAIPRSTAR